MEALSYPDLLESVSKAGFGYQTSTISNGYICRIWKTAEEFHATAYGETPQKAVHSALQAYRINRSDMDYAGELPPWEA